MRILVVEDEKDLRKIIVKQLIKENYNVDECGDGIEAVNYIESADYDGIILDVMIPKKDGWEVLKEIRAANNNTPVLMLTARDGIADRVKGLDLGADDYMVKPFAFDELLARIRVMMRRKPGFLSNRLTVGDLTLDRNKKQVFRKEKEIKLSAKEFMILEYFMRNPGIVLSRNQIEQNAYNYEFEGASNVIDVYIRYLRKKIDEGYDKKYIHTVRGLGYVLREEN